MARRFFLGDNVLFPSMATPAAISFSAWVRINTTASPYFDSDFPRLGEMAGGGVAYRSSTDRRIVIQRGGNSQTNGDALITDAAWHNYIVTSDGTDEQVFVDGVKIDTLNTTGATTNTTAGTVMLGNGHSLNRAISGDESYVSIYNEILSQAQVDEIQSSGYLAIPSLIFEGGPDCDFDSVTSAAGTVTGTTLLSGDDPAVTPPAGGGGTTELVVTRDLSWGVHAAVTATRGLLWNVESLAGTVAVIRDLSWDIREALQVDRDLLWNVEYAAVAAPANLTATTQSDSAILVEWSHAGGASIWFVVERSTDYNPLDPETATWTVIQETTFSGEPVTTQSTSYTDTGRAESTEYSYRAKALQFP